MSYPISFISFVAFLTSITLLDHLQYNKNLLKVNNKVTSASNQHKTAREFMLVSFHIFGKAKSKRNLCAYWDVKFINICTCKTVTQRVTSEATWRGWSMGHFRAPCKKHLVATAVNLDTMHLKHWCIIVNLGLRVHGKLQFLEQLLFFRHSKSRAESCQPF